MLVLRFTHQTRPPWPPCRPLGIRYRNGAFSLAPTAHTLAVIRYTHTPPERVRNWPSMGELTATQTVSSWAHLSFGRSSRTRVCGCPTGSFLARQCNNRLPGRNSGPRPCPPDSPPQSMALLSPLWRPFRLVRQG